MPSWSARLRVLLPVSAVAALACSDSTSPGGHSTLPASLALQTVASLNGYPAVYGTAPAGDSRLFLVQRRGEILILQNGAVLPTPFLDLTSQVTSADNEQGLLSMAFDPNYASNKYFYVFYTDLSGNLEIQRFTTSADPNVADPSSALTILNIAHPTYTDENGGLVLFGPDGKLYIGVGYGGSPDDNAGMAQNTDVLLGKILRIDVSASNSVTPYTIPSDNPFVGQAGKRGEIWAYGLRNPWRFAFDQPTGLLYIADVGDQHEEEVDVVPSTQGGDNYGWPLLEGTACHNSCTAPAGAIAPVFEYPHAPAALCTAIIGGVVYRGTAIAGLAGQYLYSDFCAGGLNSFQAVNGVATNQRSWSVGSTGNVDGFGMDGAGELYLLEDDGTVAKIVAGG